MHAPRPMRPCPSGTVRPRQQEQWFYLDRWRNSRILQQPMRPSIVALALGKYNGLIAFSSSVSACPCFQTQFCAWQPCSRQLRTKRNYMNTACSIKQRIPVPRRSLKWEASSPTPTYKTLTVGCQHLHILRRSFWSPVEGRRTRKLWPSNVKTNVVKWVCSQTKCVPTRRQINQWLASVFYQSSTCQNNAVSRSLYWTFPRPGSHGHQFYYLKVIRWLLKCKKISRLEWSIDRTDVDSSIIFMKSGLFPISRMYSITHLFRYVRKGI